MTWESVKCWAPSSVSIWHCIISYSNNICIRHSYMSLEVWSSWSSGPDVSSSMHNEWDQYVMSDKRTLMMRGGSNIHRKETVTWWLVPSLLSTASLHAGECNANSQYDLSDGREMTPYVTPSEQPLFTGEETVIECWHGGLKWLPCLHVYHSQLFILV